MDENSSEWNEKNETSDEEDFFKGVSQRKQKTEHQP